MVNIGIISGGGELPLIVGKILIKKGGVRILKLWRKKVLKDL